MIKNSPESPMPEPYRGYVEQRAQAIANTLEPVVDGTDIQLCPRAIAPEEQLFADGIVYGCVVEQPQDGYKSALYTTGNAGIHARFYEQAGVYADQIFEQGNRVRVKHPDQLNGHGQYTVESIDELYTQLDSYDQFDSNGIVLMPHLTHIDDRFSAGRINLGTSGNYEYIGRELMGIHDGEETFIGGDLIVARHDARLQLDKAAEKHTIPATVRRLARRTLDAYAAQVIHAGRYSVDIISGTTDNGQRLIAATDITPRVGGHTPTESMAIAALHENDATVAFASGRLHYDPSERITPSGVRFIDTPSLIMSAEVQEVRGSR